MRHLAEAASLRENGRIEREVTFISQSRPTPSVQNEAAMRSLVGPEQ